jgi:pimeloyl-ACP methyl ester carboxylesterase
MRRPAPFVREAGSGPRVVCLHSNASTSAQWRGLIDRLAPRHHVLAPDGYGSGRSPEWPSDRVIALRDEVALIEPLLGDAGPPVALVGHSYGAAVALVAAVERPQRVRALALYEPTLIALADAESPPPNETAGIRGAVERAAAALDAGDRDAAAEAFIDYWMGDGSWAQTPEARKPAIADSVANVRRWAHALMTEPSGVAALRALDMPVLLMSGRRSTASAHAVARIVAASLPRVTRVEFDGLGHMGPITHPDAVNAAIQAFLERT